MHTNTGRSFETATSESDETPADSERSDDAESAPFTRSGSSTVTDRQSSTDTERYAGFDDANEWIGTQHCDLPPDVVFDVLKNQRRRLVLQFLREREDPVKLGTLAEHIAAFENGISPTALNAQQRKRVYIGLYQCHLPKMADAGVIDFNQERGIVAMSDSGEALLEFLDADGESTASPRPFLFALGAGGIAFVAARLFFPLWAVDVVVVGLLVSIVVLVTTRESAD